MTSVATRTRKKNLRRGHVATPPLVGDIRLRHEPGFIPGVPSFHQGGGIHAHPHGPLTPGEPGTVAGPGVDPIEARIAAFVEGGTGISAAQIRSAISLFGGFGISPEQSLNIIGTIGLENAFNFLTQTPGGGGTDPAQLAIQQANLAIRQAELELDRAIRTGSLDLQRQAQDSLDQARQRADLISIRQSQLDAGVQQRGQDINAALSMLQLVQQEADSQRRDALARGNLELAQQAEQRAQVALQLSTQLEQRGQDITVRGQDINAALQTNQLLLSAWQIGNDFAISSGNLQLARETEERLRAESQQQVALSQFEAELSRAGLGIQAQTSAAGQAGQLAIGLGNIEARRAEFLSELQANPRDFIQLQNVLGGGQNFLRQLASGQPFEGQGVGRGGDIPTLGAGFDRLATEVTRRRDLPLFEEARGLIGGLAGMARNIPQAPSLASLQGLGRLSPLAPAPAGAPRPDLAALNLPGVAQIPGLQELLAGLGSIPGLPGATPSPNLGFDLPPQLQFKHGGDLVIREPTVGIGQISGRPLFTLVEDGNPEKLRPTSTGMKVIPFQKGGKVKFEPIGSTDPVTRPPRPPGISLPVSTIGPTRPTAPMTFEPIGSTDPVTQPPRPPGIPLPVSTIPPPQVTGGPSVVVPSPSPGAPTPPGAPGPSLLRALPPRSGEVGEFQINEGVAETLLNNPILARQALERAEATGSHGPQFDWLRELVATQEQNAAAERESRGLLLTQGPMQPPGAPAGGPALSPGELIRNFMRSLTPQRVASLVPSQIQLINSIVSGLGIPPEDFWASVRAGFPQGTDPSRILFASNF